MRHAKALSDSRLTSAATRSMVRIARTAALQLKAAASAGWQRVGRERLLHEHGRIKCCGRAVDW